MSELSGTLSFYYEGMERKVLIIEKVLRQNRHDKLLHAVIPSAGPYWGGISLNFQSDSV